MVFVRALGETLSIALLGTLTAAALAFPLGILAAKTVVRHRLIPGLIRRVLDVIRGVDLLSRAFRSTVTGRPGASFATAGSV